MWRFVWCVSHTLCYQHLSDGHKHSLGKPGFSVTDGTVSGSQSGVQKKGRSSSAFSHLALCHCRRPTFSPHADRGSGLSHTTPHLVASHPCCSFFFYKLNMAIDASQKPWPNPVILLLQQPGRHTRRDPKSRQPKEPCRPCPYQCESGLSRNTIGV